MLHDGLVLVSLWTCPCLIVDLSLSHYGLVLVSLWTCPCLIMDLSLSHCGLVLVSLWTCPCLIVDLSLSHHGLVLVSLWTCPSDLFLKYIYKLVGARNMTPISCSFDVLQSLCCIFILHATENVKFEI